MGKEALDAKARRPGSLPLEKEEDPHSFSCLLMDPLVSRLRFLGRKAFYVHLSYSLSLLTRKEILLGSAGVCPKERIWAVWFSVQEITSKNCFESCSHYFPPAALPLPPPSWTDSIFFFCTSQSCRSTL